MTNNSNRLSRVSFHRNLIILLIVLSIFIQGIIIAFSYFRQHVTFESSEHFIIIFSTRLIVGFLSSIIVAYPFVFLINYFNRQFPWSKSIFKRIILQLFSIIIFTIIVSLGSNQLVETFYPAYKLDITLISNDLMIYAVSNIILVIVLEAWMFYDSNRIAQLESKLLKDRLLKMNYEMLKNQIKPHFLFNSMSVLSGLINHDPEVAQKFIKEYTSMYRYIIESLEVPVTKLSDEIKFVESYIYLQQQRFGPSLIVSKHIEIDLEKYVLPPMSLQVIIENAIKHNTIDNESPLTIHIYNIQTDIYVKNNIQPKMSSVNSTHIGQKNLISRYELICKRSPVFMEYENYYIGMIPVLNPDFELTAFAKTN